MAEKGELGSKIIVELILQRSINRDCAVRDKIFGYDDIS